MNGPVVNDTSAVEVPLWQAFLTWCRVAMLSFGGPAGQIAVMHRILLEEKKWLREEDFLHALSYCMLLPGPEAQQLATYIGWRMHGLRGGLMAGTLFILPGFVAILILSVLYVNFQGTALLLVFFAGMKPAVVAIVIDAVLRIGRRVLKNRLDKLVAALSFISLFAFDLPFPLVIAVAGLIGVLLARWHPDLIKVGAGHVAGGKASAGDFIPVRLRPVPRPGWRRFLGVSALCLTLWFGPLAAVAVWLGRDSVYVAEGLFFSQAAVVTFGGAYSVLNYVAQMAVDHFGWLKPGEMLDGLGLAESTPGPLIMVVQFVGFLGAWRTPEPLTPMTGAILASILTTWVTFVPCFYWIFLGAPYVEQLKHNRMLSAALATIMAAVSGVVLNLAVWFGLHVLFGSVASRQYGPMCLAVPEWSTLNSPALLLSVVACVLMLRFKRGIVVTLGVSVLLGAILHIAWPDAR